MLTKPVFNYVQSHYLITWEAGHTIICLHSSNYFVNWHGLISQIFYLSSIPLKMYDDWCKISHMTCRPKYYDVTFQPWLVHVGGQLVSWEPEGRYCSSKMFRWEPEGHYCCTKSMAIAPFWFSMEHLWSAIAPFWLSADELWLVGSPYKPHEG